MDKKILIDQPGFIGDIIFVMAIAQKYLSDGYIVDFPIFENYFTQNIQKNFPEINFIPIKQFGQYKNYSGVKMFEDSEYIFIPLRNSANRMSHQHMKEKYEFLNLDFNMWRDIVITRDYDKERELFKILEIDDNLKYDFINKNWGFEFREKEIKINNNNNKNIYMSLIEGFNVFDWIGVMEKAESIHTIGTSIIFLMDSIKSMPKEMHIYPRDDKAHSSYDYLLNKKHILH